MYCSRLLMHSPKIHLRGTCKIICGRKTQKLRFRVMLYMHESISSEKQGQTTATYCIGAVESRLNSTGLDGEPGSFLYTQQTWRKPSITLRNLQQVVVSICSFLLFSHTFQKFIEKQIFLQSSITYCTEDMDSCLKKNPAHLPPTHSHPHTHLTSHMHTFLTLFRARVDVLVLTWLFHALTLYIVSFL